MFTERKKLVKIFLLTPASQQAEEYSSFILEESGANKRGGAEQTLLKSGDMTYFLITNEHVHSDELQASVEEAVADISSIL